MAVSGEAAPITWSFTGPVEAVGGNFVGVLPLGTPANLTVTWESSKTNSQPSCPPGSGLFFGDLSATLSFLDYEVVYGSGAVEVRAPNGSCTSNFPPAVEFHLFTNYQAPSTEPNFREILMLVTPTDVNALTLGDILANVDKGYINVQTGIASNPSSTFRFQAPLQTVPEPATMLLFGSGLVITMRAARRRSVSRRAPETAA
jgi:hypothetical protein